MKALATALFGRAARRRWVHLILGGALAMPYVFVGSLIVSPLVDEDQVLGSFSSQLAAFAAGLPLAAVTALFPLTRPMSVAAVRALCAVPHDSLAEGPARGRVARGRTAAWFTLHLGLGGVISGMSLGLPPLAAVLIAVPFFAVFQGHIGMPEVFGEPWMVALSPVIGCACLVALAACAATAGGVLARWAPALLGPTPADRLAAAEQRAADLAVRNRLARELHDSVGHALSAVTLQASAARRVLDHDPEFVREALAAIEDTTRRTVGELDAVLGVLREADDARSTAPAPTLAADLEGLLRRTRAGGLRVSADVGMEPAALPPLVSREAYRIVQEALSNALRHGGDGTAVTLRITLDGPDLAVTAENPLPPHAPATRPGGGHGLRGIADRARLLGGTADAGPADGAWRLDVRLPLKGHT
ncbi:sensor histidine kinase [Streptomyces sp. NRRL S-920]|uniref:sensor histidine kinase n=1 Tax=Streptomyces sp. NRRL S-920 TaxID=1463921 RepID=UPI0004C93547|nr:histidine kinase [Streptomyces sp. NRRL S-920]